jgi:hypothetical protein
MTNLVVVSLAYKMAVAQLMLGEANFHAQKLDLQLQRPIPMEQVRVVMVRSPHFKEHGGVIEVSNYLWSFAEDGKLFKLLKRGALTQEASKPQTLRETQLELARQKSLVDKDGAYRLATNWLTQISVDVSALNKKYAMRVEQEEFSDPPGQTKTKKLLPIYNVKWGKDSKHTAV